MPSPLSRLGLGRIVYQLYHRPAGSIRDCIAAGGPFVLRRTRQGEASMARAARELPILPAGKGPPVTLYLLTGQRFWHRTAFCLWTFARQSGRSLTPVIYDDGTLTAEHQAPLLRLFPATRFVSKTDIVAHLDTHLPSDRFPFLRDRWLNYPNIRKLIDPHLGSTGWKLILDSDLLFFHSPNFLTRWCDAPDRPLHAVDCETSYGYPDAMLAKLAGAPLSEKVNVGLCGLRSESLDWDQLETWCRELITRQGTHYYLEQALVAMLVAGRPCAIAPAEDYVTLPDPVEATARRAVMHHYVASSKRWYFQLNWRAVLAN